MFGRYLERFTALKVSGNIAVVAVPVVLDGLHAAFDRLTMHARSTEDALMVRRFGRLVDVAGAKSFLLRIDPVLDESAFGTDDPPAGPVEPADPARFDLKEDILEFQDDSSVPAGIDAFPRCGSQPSRQSLARAQAKLESLVDQMAPQS